MGTKNAFVFYLFECRLFLYLVVVIVCCLLVAIVKPLGLISKWGAQQSFIIIIISCTVVAPYDVPLYARDRRGYATHTDVDLSIHTVTWRVYSL